MATYTVKKGDSLWDIAKAQLGTKTNADTAAAVKRIWDRNKSVVGQPKGTIQIGAKLTLPGGAAKTTTTKPKTTTTKPKTTTSAAAGERARALGASMAAKDKEIRTKSTARPKGATGPSKAKQVSRTENQKMQNVRAGGNPAATNVNQRAIDRAAAATTRRAENLAKAKARASAGTRPSANANRSDDRVYRGGSSSFTTGKPKPGRASTRVNNLNKARARANGK